MNPINDTHQKCLSINLNQGQYGSIAEIGAGQETARWFFRTGGAAGTLAKAISAYDMQFSDAIYGESPRYVSRDRLRAMLELEYRLIEERLDEKRGDNSTFFAFANTVASRSFSRQQDGQGWLGIRFQTTPRSAPSQIDLHVHLTGKQTLQDQESLGVLGVNLIYGALNYAKDPETLMRSLMDDLRAEHLEIDMIDFNGPAFSQVDNRLMALRLVEMGLSPGAMFNPQGEVIQAADLLYDRPVLVERSRFRPPTKLTMGMLERARDAFVQEHACAAEDLVVLSEMTLNNLREGENIDARDFLQRADILCALGKNVLVSNMGEYYRLADYLFRCTRQPMAIALGIPTLRQLLNEEHYQKLPGGILEAMGRLFQYSLNLYVCPTVDPSGQFINLENFEAPASLVHLYRHLLDNEFIRPLDNVPTDYLSIQSDQVFQQIRQGQSGWRDQVPEPVRQLIETGQFFCSGA